MAEALRPQDIGEQFPGANPSVQPVAEGRGLVDHGTRTVAEDLGQIFTAGDITPSIITVLQVIITAEFNDTLACRTIDDADTIGSANIIVAKPRHLRKSVYEVTNDFLIIQGSGSQRAVLNIEPNSNSTTIRSEVVSPGYGVTTLNPDGTLDVLGSVIYIGVGQSVKQTGSNNLIDLNSEARQWVRVEPDYRYFQVTAINKDTLVCQEWDFNAALGAGAQKIDGSGALLPAVNVAKPWELRGSRWESKTISGVEYFSDDGTSETSGHTTRDGEGGVEEQQLIIPVYEIADLPERSIIRASFVEAGTGAFLAGVQAMWQDTNDAGRAWSEAFA